MKTREVVIVGMESALGAALSAHYGGLGERVRNVADADEGPIDLLIFADDFSAAPPGLAAVDRERMAAGLERLAFLPFRLATRLRPALAEGARVVLLSRKSAAMDYEDGEGLYTERPFRAAAHALFKCLAVDWRDEAVSLLVLALDDRDGVEAIAAAIAEAAPEPGGLPYLDLSGNRLSW